MRDDQIAELEKLQEMMTDDMLKIGFAAVDLGFESKEDRGDKVWLYKGFNQCSSAVAKDQPNNRNETGDYSACKYR